jgi:hypothetical protein
MRVATISGSGNWDHFMKLAQQARTRNSGLSGNLAIDASLSIAQNATINASSSISGTAKQRPIMPVQAESTPVQDMKNQLYSANRPAENVRILGGQFDAWA